MRPKPLSYLLQGQIMVVTVLDSAYSPAITVLVLGCKICKSQRGGPTRTSWVYVYKAEHMQGIQHCMSTHCACKPRAAITHHRASAEAWPVDAEAATPAQYMPGHEYHVITGTVRRNCAIF